MAFGDRLGTLTNNAISITNPFAATGSVSVSVGDLVFAVMAEQTDVTVSTVTDNLGHSYSAVAVGTDAGTITGRAYYVRVTTAGTLTSVSAVTTASSNNVVFNAVAYAGPFAVSPLDKAPADGTADVTSPFTCPATGTLSQNDELVICWGNRTATSSAVWSASSPLNKDIEAFSSTVIANTIGSKVVSANTTTSPEFTSGTSPAAVVLGTATFKKDTSLPSLGPNGWYSPLSKAFVAAVAIATQATNFAVPATPSNSVSQFGWHQPLSKPVPVAQAQQGHASVPFNTAQVVPAQPSGWNQPTNYAPQTARAIATQATAFAVPNTSAATPSQFGWYSPLSKVAPPVSARAGWTFVPFNTAQVAAVQPKSGWLGQVNSAPKTATATPTQATAFAVPPSVSPPAPTPGQFGWYAPLSKAVPVAQAKPGNTFVPFDTQVGPNTTGIPLYQDAGPAPIQTVYYQARIAPPAYLTPIETFVHWQQPLSRPVPVAQAQQGHFSVPFNRTQIVVQPPGGWYMPLSVAVPVAQARQGNAFVPFNTAQTFITPNGWYAPLSTAVPVAQARQGHSVVPFNTAQIVVLPPRGWYVPLSTAVPVARPRGDSFVAFNGAAPLSLAVDAGVYTVTGFDVTFTFSQNDGWTPATKENEGWTDARRQNETWIPATKQTEPWTDE